MKYIRKIYQLSDLKKIREEKKQEKFVLVGGCFDIFHYGHLHFLTQARKKGTYLIVLLESDEYINLTKHKQPVHTQKQRALLLAALEVIDCVILLPQSSHRQEMYENILSVLRPQFIIWTKGDVYDRQKKLLARKFGSRVVRISLLKPFSSSQLITYAPIFRN